MVRSPSGRPNGFISREDTPGEDAFYGDGFYTHSRVGEFNGVPVRLAVDPSAREGVDSKGAAAI